MRSFSNNIKVGKFSEFKLPLKSMPIGTHQFEYRLGKEFFVNMESSDIRNANLFVKLSVTHKSDIYDLNFNISGEITLLCDRCLDDMKQEVNSNYHIVVKYGDEYCDDSDEVLEIPESDNYLNVAYMIYDTVSLSIPIKQKAVAQIGPQPRRSGRSRMVVDSSVASRLVAPVINAINGSALQQKMSFLDGTLGQKVFSEGMTLMDLPRTAGKNGSRMYDSEGVATKDAPIIKDGVVSQYFINTYNAAKMGIEPTVEDASRPLLMPYMKGIELADKENSVSLKDILQYCKNGILVTGFNGGNTNPVTGDFSFGIEGFAFSKGKITHPVREMLITGNLKDLWNSFIAAGTDARPSSRWQIPTIAFENVSFSA